MKRLLVVGDSLAAGHPGASFTSVLAQMTSSCTESADGRGGDTLLGISKRLLPLLHQHAPHVLVIEAGTNVEEFRCMQKGSWISWLVSVRRGGYTIMRLRSLHPSHLDSKGRIALWREGLLALRVLQCSTKGYRNHPPPKRFLREHNPVETGN